MLSRLIAVLYDRVFAATAINVVENSSDNNTTIDTSAGVVAEGEMENREAVVQPTFKCSSGRLSRLLFVLGQGAICSLVYAEKVAALAKKVRERKTLQEKEAAYTRALQDGQSMVVGAEGNVQQQEQEADSMEAEMGMAAATDAEHEQVSPSPFLCLHVLQIA